MKIKTKLKAGQSSTSILDGGGSPDPDPVPVRSTLVGWRWPFDHPRDGVRSMKVKSQVKAGQSNTSILDGSRRSTVD